MTNRLIVTLGAVLALAGSVIAQQPLLVAAPLERTVPVAAPFVAPTEIDEGSSLWLSADYLLGIVYSSKLQPQATTSPVGTPRVQAGAFNQPSKTFSLLDGRVNTDERSGLRLQCGGWLDDERRIGLEVGFSVLESLALNFSSFSDGSVILARPYVNATNSTHEAVVIAFPGISSGGLTLSVTSGNFYEGHVDLSENFWEDDAFRLDGLIGYRFYRYDEGYRYRQIITTTQDPDSIPGTSIYAGDDFSTQNEFHGCEIGLRGTIRSDDLSLELLGKVAAGGLRRRIKISGGQRVTVPGEASELRTGGVFALPTNIGQYDINDWATMPELGCTVRYQATDWMRLRVGYNVLFLNGISRAVDQVNQFINPAFFPASGLPESNPRQPAPTNNKDDIWIMTASFGVELFY